MSDTKPSLNPNAPEFTYHSTHNTVSNVAYIVFQPLTPENIAGHQLPATNLCTDTSLSGDTGNY